MTRFCVSVWMFAVFGLLCDLCVLSYNSYWFLIYWIFARCNENHPGHFRISKHVLILVNLHAFIIIWYQNNIKLYCNHFSLLDGDAFKQFDSEKREREKKFIKYINKLRKNWYRTQGMLLFHTFVFRFMCTFLSSFSHSYPHREQNLLILSLHIQAIT